jgi:uncharacterized lipoprotein
MKSTLILSAALLFLGSACGTNRKYDKKRLEVQKQEAHEMIKNADEVEINRARFFGKDKIKLD